MGMGGEEECIQDFDGKAREKHNNSEDLYVGRKVILKLILLK
jgi:hypothetical protein